MGFTWTLLNIYKTYFGHIYSPLSSLVFLCPYWFSSSSYGFWFDLTFVCFCDPVKAIRVPYRNIGTFPMVTLIPLKKMSLCHQQSLSMSPLGWMESCKPLPNQRQMVPKLRLTQVLSSADSYFELMPCWAQSSTNYDAQLILASFLSSFPWWCPLHLEAVACHHACLWDSTTWIFMVSTRRSRCREDFLPVASLVVHTMRRWKTESYFLTPSVSRSCTVQSDR